MNFEPIPKQKACSLLSFTAFAVTMLCKPLAGAMLHIKCRNNIYPRSNQQRLHVPDERVPWSKVWKNYHPPSFTMDYIKGKPWADPEIGNKNFNPKWNDVDGNVNRTSHVQTYEIRDGYPLNPVGRTGLSGRGVLGRWGPNHAADPIVTRWKRSKNLKQFINENSKKPVLQFVAIQRRDSGEWALPGGMVDPGEVVTSTVKREFMEEALNILENRSFTDDVTSKINSFFENGEEIYRGYVDDPRNTDNAWMETVAMLFHDEAGDIVGTFPLSAGDDAVGVTWMDIDHKLPLYASHSDLLQIVVSKMNCHW